MNVVGAAESFVRDRGMEPSSVLLLDLGGSLTSGSFTTRALLLSLRLYTKNDDIHAELWEALAAPQKIVVIVSAPSCTKNALFFKWDYGEDIRHKVLFIPIPGTLKETWRCTAGGTLTSFFLDPGGKHDTHRCLENRDNLFWEQSFKPIRSCNAETFKCKFGHFAYWPHTFPGQNSRFHAKFRLGFTCNGSHVENIYSVGYTSMPPLRTALMLMSLYHIRSPRFSHCLSDIPLETIDVTALVEPFEPEVWWLVVATVVLLGVAWALIVRKSAPIFCTELTLGTVTCCELTLAPKRYSDAMIGCVALSFAFIVGQIYSNTVMSSFLDPTFEFSEKYPMFTCTGESSCYNETFLSFSLGLRPVCDTPSLMRGIASKPLKKWRSSGPVRFFGPYEFVTLEATSGSNTVYMGLSVTRTSDIFSRLEQHAVFSPATLTIHGEKLIRRDRDRAKMAVPNPDDPDPISSYKRGAAATRVPLYPPFEYVEFNTTRDVFDISEQFP